MLSFSVPFATSAFLGLGINRLCCGSALCVTSATTSARSKTCDVLCIPARYLVTLAILSGGGCSRLLHFPAKAGLETTAVLCWMECDANYVNIPVFSTGILQNGGSPEPDRVLHVPYSMSPCCFSCVPKLEKWYQACESWMVGLCSAQSLSCWGVLVLA